VIFALTLTIIVFAWQSALSTTVCLLPHQDKSTMKQDSGVLIRWMGKDTTAIQRFVIKGDSVYSKILFIPRGITISEGSGTLFPDGTLESMHSKVFTVSAKGQLQLTQETHLTTSADSTWIHIVRDKQNLVRSYRGRGFVTNDADITSFQVFPFWGLYAPKQIGDSLSAYHFSSGRNRDYSIKRIGSQSLRVGGSLMGFLTLFLDKSNHLDSMNGVGSTQNWIAKVQRNINFDSIANIFLARQQQSGVEPPMSVRDTVKFTNGNVNATINYWRPSARGRKIFGEVVPYNRFWRVGANNATEIQINQPIYFGDKRLDAGKYTVFVMPTLERWTLMFNKKTGIWGTDYDASEDVLHVPMSVESLPKYIEQLTISLVPTSNGGTMNIDWERTRTALTFSTK